MKYVASFARFWYDFIVGDSVILAIGGVASLALGATLLEVADSPIAEVVLPLTILGTLVLSLLIPRR